MARIRMAKVHPQEMEAMNESRGMFEAHNASIRSIVDRMRNIKPKNSRYSEFSKAVKAHQDEARIHQSRMHARYVTAKPTGSFEPNESHMKTRYNSSNN